MNIGSVGAPLGRVAARLARYPASTAAAVAALFFATPLALGEVYLGLDHTRVLLAALCAARGLDGAVLDAELGGGGPLLEDPQGLLLSPLAWLLRPLPVELAASAFSVVHLAIGAAAVVALARSFGLRRRAACWAGLAWPLCGTCVNLILHGAYVVDAAGLPLAWAGARRALIGRPDGAILVAVGLALLGLCGELQGALVALGLVALEAIAALLRERRRPRPRALQRFLGLGLGASAGLLAVGAVASLALGLAGAAARAQGVSDPFGWPLALPELVGVAWPNAVVTRDSVGATLQTAAAGDALLQPPWNGTPYLGLPLLAAALVGLLASRRRRSARVVAVVTTLSSLGAATPVYPALIALVPLLSMFRYPAKYLVVATLAGIVVGIGALDAATRAHRLRRAILAVLAALGIGSVAGVAGVLINREALATAAGAVAVRAPAPWAPPLATVLATAGLTASAVCALAVLLLLGRSRRRGALVPLLVVVDLAVAAVVALPTGAPLLADRAALRELQPQGGWPAGAVVCLGAELGARRVELPDRDLGVLADIAVDLIDGKPGTGQCTGVAAPNTYLPSAQAETIALARRIDERPGAPGDGLQAARALGCTHLVTRANVDGHAELRALPRAPGAPTIAPRAYALVTPVPEVTVARTPVLLPDGRAAVAAVLSSRGVDEAVRLLDGAGARASALPASLPSGAGARSTASFDSTTKGRLRVEGAGAVVVLRRPWWPGFVAESETGRGLPVLRAAGALLAVVVDDEEVGHEITVRYRVVGAPLAVLCGAMASALVAALSAWWLRERRTAARGRALP